MKVKTFMVAEDADDLADLPAGTRIVTAGGGRIVELDVIEPGRKDSGSTYWIEDGSLTPFPRPPEEWFPAIIIPQPNKYDL